MNTTQSVLRRTGWLAVLLLGSAAVLAMGVQESPQGKGAAYLKSVQAQDGSWSSVELRLVDTAESVETLALALASVEVGRGAEFASKQTATATDGLARKLLAASRTAADTGEVRAALLAQQNPDGSWAARRGQRGTPLDSAVALRALARASSFDAASFERAVAFIDGRRLPSGGWPLQEAETTDLWTTAQVIHALADFALQSGFASDRLATNLSAGTAYLLTQQNGDGSFGASKKVVQTSWAIFALLRTTQPAALNSAETYLVSQQQTNGSWANNVYQTALATRALAEKSSPPTAPADLGVASISFAPASPVAGQATIINATITNGGGRAAREVDVQLKDGATALGPVVTIPSIGAGKSAGVQVSAVFSAGTHTITATADPAGTVVESNEANNSLSTALVVGSGILPDLSISAFSFSPPTPVAGQSITLSATVTNGGTATAFNVAVRFLDGTNTLGSDVVVGSLASGESKTFSRVVTLAAGSHPLAARVDPDGQIAESNEANNQAGATATVGASVGTLPDLAVTSLAPSKSAPAAGEPVTLTATVANVGAAFSGPTPVFRLYDGDPSSGGVQIGTEVLLSGLSSGSVATVNVTASFSQGIHKIVGLADATGLLLETSEANNTASAYLAVGAGTLPNLAVLSVTASKLTLDNGESVLLSATVKNTGAVPTGGFAVQFYDGAPVGGGRAGAPVGVNSLAPGAQTIAQVLWVPAVGTHHVEVRVDDTNRVAESDESDNVATGPDINVTTTPFVEPLLFTEVGSDFWLVYPQSLIGISPADALVSIHADASTTWTMSGAASDSGTVAPGSPAQVFLPASALVSSTQTVTPGKGIHITSPGKIRVYLVFADAFGTTKPREATLVLPKPVLGTSHQVASFGEPNFIPGQTSFVVLGVTNGTSVTVQVAAPVVESFTFTLNQGDAWRYTANLNIQAKVTGSSPIALFSATSESRTNQPSTFGSVVPNPILEQMPPSDLYGMRHVVGPNLLDALYIRVRVHGHEDGTQVTVKRNGLADDTFSLNSGDFKDIDASAPTEVLSTKPVFVVRYMNEGDSPTLAWVPPVAAASSSYRFPTLVYQSIDASYGTFVAPLGETSIRVNGVLSKAANSFEGISGSAKSSNEAFASTFEFGGTAASEAAVSSTRPTLLHLYGSSFGTNRFGFAAGFRAAKKPDPVVASLELSQNPAFTGVPLTLTATILNASYVDATSFRVRFFDGDPEAGGLPIGPDQTIAALAREATTTVSVEWSPSIPGDRALTAIIDPVGELSEADESNNVFVKPITVRSTVDLSGGLGLSGATFFGNQQLGIDTGVFNNSTNAALGTLVNGQLEIVIEDSFGNVVATLPAVSMTDISAVPDGLAGWTYFAEFSFTPAKTLQNGSIVAAPVNFTALLQTLGDSNALDVNSLRAVEIAGQDFAVRDAVLLPGPGFSASTNAAGVVELVVPGPLTQGAQRRFRIYFDTSAAPKPATERVNEPAYGNDKFANVTDPGGVPTSLILSDRKGGLSVQPVTGTDTFLVAFRSVQSVALGDFNGDRRYDVARIQGSSGTAFGKPLYVLSTAGANALVTERPGIWSVKPLNDNERLVHAADMNGDGRLDLLVRLATDAQPTAGNAGFVSQTAMQIYLQDADGTFRLSGRTVVTQTQQILHFDTADVDGDGTLDLVVSMLKEAGGGGVDITQRVTRVFKGNGDGTLSSTPIDSPSVPAPSGGNAWPIVTGDFDSDGKVDLFLPPFPQAPQGYLAKGNGDGSFQTPVEIPGVSAQTGVLNGFALSSAFAMDYNRDGKLDVILPTTSTGEVRVAFGTGTGSFSGFTAVTAPHDVASFSGLKLNRVTAGGPTGASRNGFLKGFTFNIGSTLPGLYHVRMNVRDAQGRLLFTTTKDFTVQTSATGSLSDILAAQITPNLAGYQAGDTAILTSTAINQSPNDAVTDLVLKIVVTNSSSTVVFTDQQLAASLPPQSSQSVLSFFPVGTNAPGTYTATLTILNNNVAVKTDTATFQIVSTAKFSGTVAANPATVAVGSPFDITFTVANLGNIAFTDLPAVFKVVQPSTTLTLATFNGSIASLPVGGSASGTIAGSATGLTPGTYLLYFQVNLGGTLVGVAQAQFTVIAAPANFFQNAVFGTAKVKMSGQANTADSTGTNTGHVRSNQQIQLSGQALVRGDAVSAGGPGSVTLTGKASVLGSIITNASAITLNAADTVVNNAASSNNNAAIGLTSGGNNPLTGTTFAMSGFDTITLNAGAYYFTEFKLSSHAQVNCNGVVRIYLDGALQLSAWSVLNSSADPSKLIVISKSALGIDFSGNALVWGAVYAPDAKITGTGQAAVRGALVGHEADLDGQFKVTRDPQVNTLSGFVP